MMKGLRTTVELPSKAILLAVVTGLLLMGCGGGDGSPVCGDGTCEVGETSISCPADCPEGFCPAGSECTSNADCEALEGPRFYCNIHTCACWECLEDSDNCRTDEECQVLMADPGATCIPALCSCAPSCPEDSPCWGLPPDYACKTASGASGTCQDCACVPTTCGNDVVDAGEECEGGVAPGTCEEVCDASLYDGAVPCGPDPACDRGGCEAGFYCNASCACEAAPTNVCGDRYVSHEEGEQCEPFGCVIFTDTETCPTDLAPDTTCTEVPGGIERCALNEFCSLSIGEVCDPVTCQCIAGAPEPIPLCGNGVCDSVLGETCSTCETDCGPCPAGAASVCGDGTCDASVGEHPCTCPGDCTWAICAEIVICGDGFCDPVLGENCETCSDDCGACGLPGADGSLCGDGICQEGESAEWCGDCAEDKEDPEPEPEEPPAPEQPVCGDGVWEPKLGEECDPPGTICYDSNGAAGDCYPDCTCRGPS